jgi:hypothetical protein
VRIGQCQDGEKFEARSVMRTHINGGE